MKRPVSNPPKITLNYFLFEDDTRAYIGTIIRRPTMQSYGLMYHFAIFWGCDDKGNIWLAQNNITGVGFVDFKTFMAGEDAYSVDVCLNDSLQGVITERFNKCKNDVYHFQDNNCETFCNYLLYGKRESEQTNFISKVVDILEFGITFNEYFDTSGKTTKTLDKIRNRYNRLNKK